MLVFTKIQNIVDNSIVNDSVIFNLSSFVEGYDRLNLITPFNIVNLEGKDFDIAYADYLLRDNTAFIEVMEKIVIPLYNNKNVIILVNSVDDDVFEKQYESLQKYLQQRYFIISNNVFEVEDWEMCKDSDFSNAVGLYNLDIDKERYSILTIKIDKEE